jgi:5-methyltetrahydrofolate--homocysteine methyltransferase
MQALMQDYLDQNVVNIIGGCCGTTPEHIAKIAAIAAQATPRKRNAPSHVS